MAQHAFVFRTTDFVMMPNGDLQLTAETQYWEEDGSQLTFSSDPAQVQVTVTPGMNASQMVSAMMSAVKAYALQHFGWNMATNSVIAPSFARN